MNRLEIIHLRTSRAPLSDLGKRISESIQAETNNEKVVTMYLRDGLETDIAIHIRRHEEPTRNEPSTVGLHLASALKAYGLIEHTLWEELI